MRIVEFLGMAVLLVGGIIAAPGVLIASIGAHLWAWAEDRRESRP